MEFVINKNYVVAKELFAGTEGLYNKKYDNANIVAVGKGTTVKYLGYDVGNGERYLKFMVVSTAGGDYGKIICLGDDEFYRTNGCFVPVVDSKFKPGDKVELFRSNAGNKVGRVFTFVDYLPEAVGNLDCVCKTAEGASTFGISKNLRLVAEKEPIRKKIGQADLLKHLFNDKSYVDVYRNGNKTIALYFEYDEEGKKNVYEGVARCNPNDKFDPLFGVALAVARAMGDEDKEELLLNEGLIA